MTKFVSIDTPSGAVVWVNPDAVATVEPGTDSARTGSVIRFVNSTIVVITNDKPSSVASWLEAAD